MKTRAITATAIERPDGRICFVDNGGAQLTGWIEADRLATVEDPAIIAAFLAAEDARHAATTLARNWSRCFRRMLLHNRRRNPVSSWDRKFYSWAVSCKWRFLDVDRPRQINRHRLPRPTWDHAFGRLWWEANNRLNRHLVRAAADGWAAWFYNAQKNSGRRISVRYKS